MKNKITFHIILCGLLSTASMTFAMEIALVGNELDKYESPQSKSPRQNSPIASPKQPRSASSSRSPSPIRKSGDKLMRGEKSPRIKVEETSKNAEQIIETFYARATSNTKYCYVLASGSLNKDLTLDSAFLTYRNNHYEAKIIESNNQYFVITTHRADEANWAQHLNEEEQSSIKTTLTEKQVQMLLHNLLSEHHDNAEMLVFDNESNSYHISHENFPKDDLSIVQGEIEKRKKAYPIAVIQDQEGYLCYISPNGDNNIDIYKENSPGNFRRVNTIPIPNDEKDYTILYNIAHDQWVVINKNRQLYIKNNGTYTPQSNMGIVDNPSLKELIPNLSNQTIIITPLKVLQPTESMEQTKAPDTTATTSTTSNPDKQEQKTLKPDTKKPDANKTTSNATYLIGSGTALMAIIAILYYHHELSTFFSDLFSKISHSVQNSLMQ